MTKPAKLLSNDASLHPMTFGSLRSRSPEIEGRLREFILEVNKAGGTYHRLDFGDNLAIQGEYDMTKYVQFYHLPSSLQGKKVLDIGTASGYFAFECARRGGEVTAIDIYDQPLLGHLLPLIEADIHYVKRSIYELDPSWGQFDLVVCGSVLVHLPDLWGAIQRIRGVCRGRAVVSTACTLDSQKNPRPICEFRGLKAVGGDYWHFWDVSSAALKAMLLAAGFSQVEEESHFILTSDPGRKEFATPHVVMAGVA